MNSNIKRKVFVQKRYWEWTAGETDYPFQRKDTWVGDMVMGFVEYCLIEQEKEIKKMYGDE
jgi:hypothetical protein